MFQYQTSTPGTRVDKIGFLSKEIIYYFFGLILLSHPVQGLSCHEAFGSRLLEAKSFLAERWEKLSQLPGNERMKGYFYKEIEGIPLGLKPSILRPRVRLMAVRANRFLQRKDLFLDFYFELYLEIRREVYRLNKESEISAQGALPRQVTLQVLRERAKRHGWDKMVEVPLDVSHPQGLLSLEKFRNFLKQGDLFLDPAGRYAKSHRNGLYHSESAHLLQFLFLAHYLRSEFGARALKDEFIPYLATKRGYDLWEHLFDRGGSERTDLRFPAVYGDLNLTGPGSLFGLY